MDGEAALAGWRRVVKAVHEAGGRIFCQLWHVGLQVSGGPAPADGLEPVGPSMTTAEIERVMEAYGKAAANAQSVGFDGLELHGAHGYLIDQFFWSQTNSRTDAYGGDLVRRTRFAAEAIAQVRRSVGPAFPVGLRISQWKIADYGAKLVETPGELEQFLTPLTAAGLDFFHCSTRRYWDAEFEGSPLGLAGWTRKLTGKPVIAVGSVTLGADVMETFRTVDRAAVTGIDDLLERMSRDEFDLVAVGRSLLANPDWANIVRRGAMGELLPFTRDVLAQLV
jgi:2,4-dienoyl-CoA reductase-like NADH-dependent reductase (Old Yellow Enzyme family)